MPLCTEAFAVFTAFPMLGLHRGRIGQDAGGGFYHSCRFSRYGLPTVAAGPESGPRRADRHFHPCLLGDAWSPGPAIGPDRGFPSAVPGGLPPVAIAGRRCERPQPGAGRPVRLYYRTAGAAIVCPTASQTQYKNADGTGAITTSYAYTWYEDTVQVERVITTLPAVLTDQNGSGVAAQTVAWYDLQGHVIWSKDARGFLTHNEYDAITGVVTESIADVDTTQFNPNDLPIDPATS